MVLANFSCWHKHYVYRPTLLYTDNNVPMYEVSGPINGIDNPRRLISQLTLHPIRYRLLTNKPTIHNSCTLHKLSYHSSKENSRISSGIVLSIKLLCIQVSCRFRYLSNSVLPAVIWTQSLIKSLMWKIAQPTPRSSVWHESLAGMFVEFVEPFSKLILLLPFTTILTITGIN